MSAAKIDGLNRVVEYIEAHLCDEIDFATLGKIAHTNSFILERVFMFLTGVTLTNYIKQRRLSKAFEELRNTDQRVIDVALKYQYNSAAAFSRAFKQLFGITPLECRKTTGSYRMIPKQRFEAGREFDFDYNVKELSVKELYCYRATATKQSEMRDRIKDVYRQARADGRYAEFNACGMYGIYVRQGEVRNYYLGSTKEFPDLEKFVIPAGKYAELRLKSRQQSDIINFENKIDRQWAPSTNYAVKEGFKVELYDGENCYVYLRLDS